MLAAEHGHTETVQALITAGANVNVTCQQVSTCVHIGAKCCLYFHKFAKNAYHVDFDSTSK